MADDIKRNEDQLTGNQSRISILWFLSYGKIKNHSRKSTALRIYFFHGIGQVDAFTQNIFKNITLIF